MKFSSFSIIKNNDKGFAKVQYDKRINWIYIKRQLKLKTREKSGNVINKVLQNLKFKSRTKTIELDYISNINNKFYKRNQINAINDSLKLSNQSKFNSFIKKFEIVIY